MDRSRSAVLTIILVLLTVAVSGCAMGTQLLTASADPKAITGTYDLYMYGCRYPDDLEHAAFLIEPEKSPMVELFVRDTAVTIKRGLPADSALAEANKFVRCGNRTVEAIRFQQIPDGSGGTLGYEMLPRYPVTDLGGMDPLLVSYSLKEGKITVYIELSPEVERAVSNAFSPAGGP
jgi:hypothetical protein